jgi:hypothetical protein
MSNLTRVSMTQTYVYRIIEPTETETIQERHLKHIAEITKDLAPIQGEDPTFEQQEWLDFRMSRPFPKPYRRFAPIEIPYKWIDVEDTKT